MIKNIWKKHKDKILHFLVCAILSFLLCLVVKPLVSIFIVLLIALIKEMYDVLKPKPTGFNIPDLIADILGIAVGITGGKLWL